MKMEYVLKATVGGKVKSIAGKVGDNIGKGVVIVEIWRRGIDGKIVSLAITCRTLINLNHYQE